MPNLKQFNQPGLFEVLLLATGTTLGFQTIRAFIASLTWVLGDRLGLGAMMLGVVGLAVFATAFLGGALRRLIGVSKLRVYSGGGSGLSVLAIHFWRGDPVVDLALAMLGTACFGIFITNELDLVRRRGGVAPGWFVLGILSGTTLDVALNGAFGTYDAIGQRGALPGLATVLTVALLWLSLARLRAGAAPDENPSGTRALPWLAIGPFIFLQLMVYANVARAGALTGWGGPLAFGGVLLAQLAALALVAWWLQRELRRTWLVAVICGVILLLASLPVADVAAWRAALTLTAGQMAAACLLLVLVRGLCVPLPGASFRGASVAGGIGMVLAVGLIFGYYASYQIALPFSNASLEMVAAAVVALAALTVAFRRLPALLQARRTWYLPVLAAVLLLLPLGQLAFRDAPLPVAGNGLPVRVMSYNLHNGFGADGGLDMEALARVIEAAEPDIVALQEVSRGWVVSGSVDMLGWLSRRLDMPYVSGPTAGPLWGNAILSRFPVIGHENREVPPPELYLRRGYTDALIDIGGGETLRVLATHLHHYDADSQIRQIQVPLILNAWGGNTLTVVMGDMNAVTGAPEIELFRDAGLVDAAALTGAPPAPTFRADDLKRRIDYIWVSPDLVPLAVTVPGSTASDHLAVVAVIGR